MKKKGLLESDLDKPALTASLAPAAHEYVYDSLDGQLVHAEDAEVVELCDIEAAVGNPSPGSPSSTDGTPEASAPPARDPSMVLGFVEYSDDNPAQAVEPAEQPPAALSLEPRFDGVVEPGDEPEGAPLQIKRPEELDPIVAHDEVAPEIPLRTLLPSVLAFRNPNHGALSQFRVLKYKIEDYIDKHQYRSFAVTSARQGEGKTRTALNLAAVMSENPWLKLVLLDLNFRKPDLGRIMRVKAGDPGLLHVLSGRASFNQALKKLEARNLYFLHTGGTYEGSMGVLNSPQFDLFLSRLNEAFDLIIIDMPAVLDGDDALVIKQKVDSVFMVMRAEHTPIGEVNRAAKRLGKDRILGVLLILVRHKEVP